MKYVLLTFSIISGAAFAENNPEQILLNAVTVCSPDNNPLTSLTNLGGNSFGDVQFEENSESVLTANIVRNPQLSNSLIMAPARIVGKIQITMSYPAPKYSLVCNIKYL